MQTQSESASSEAKGAGMPAIKTLSNFATHFRLRDADMSNAALAEYLGVDNIDRYYDGFPSAIFYYPGDVSGRIIGVRTKLDEVAIFIPFQRFRDKMDEIADRIDLEQLDALSQVVKPDWTADKESGNANTSAEFERLCNEVERLIRGDAHMLMNGRADRTAGMIMAQLAHVHGLAPQQVKVQEYTKSDDGSIGGLFSWNGRVYRFNAVPLSS